MAIIESKEILLGDGTTATLRSGTLADMDAFENHIDVILEDGHGMTAMPGEISFPREKRKVWINELTEKPDEILIVVVQDDKLIANLDFHVGKRKRLAHTGSFGVSVQPAWRGKGIGSALLNTMIGWSIDNPRLEKISLDVLASNTPAIALYAKFGFVEEGRKVKAVKYEDGTYVDDVQMSRFV